MSYIGNEPIISATRTITEITATAGQTTFTANGGYTVGYVDVFVNGAQLQSADFTATNGSTVVLTQAAQVGDNVRLVAWGNFNAVNINGANIVDGSVTAAKIASGQILPASGIAFPATQFASSDANTLDDYEEGTWTPVLTAASGTITSQTCTGSYVKVGRVVTCVFQTQITGGTITAIGNITGFPFAFANTQNYVTACAREWFATGNLWQVIGSINSASAQLVRYDNSSAASNVMAWGGTIAYITNN